MKILTYRGLFLAIFCFLLHWSPTIGFCPAGLSRISLPRIQQGRRRQPPIRLLVHSEAIDSNNNKNNDEDRAASVAQSSQCPFSKSFPRYRVDLTRIKDTDSSSWFGSPFKAVSQTMAKAQLQQQQQKRGEEDFVWLPGLEGMTAFSALWNYAAELIQSESQQKTSILIGMPDASKQMLQNWVEIVDWMGTHPNQIEPVLRASVVESKSATTIGVRMERIKSLERNDDDDVVPEETTKRSIDTLKQRTQAWVKRILVEQGICPFTKSVKRSGQGLADVGVPVASIAYHGSLASHPITLFADTWQAICAMIQAGPEGKDGVSSILLAAPAFDDDFDFWSGPIFSMLEASVVSANAQAEIGVVCFHPSYATPDGTSWPGFGHMHSVPRLEKWHKEHSSPEEPILTTEQIAAGGAWQRRTPHATINVLRAEQLEAAESRRSSGQLYAENINKLVGATGIGSEKLSEDLEAERQLGCPLK